VTTSVVAKALPHGGIALETGTKRNLPNAVSLFQPPFAAGRRRRPALALRAAHVAVSCDEVQLVPDGSGGDVAIAEEGEARRLEVVWREGQVLLDGIDHRTPTRVHANPLESLSKIGHVRRQLLGRAMKQRCTEKEVVHDQQVYCEGVERALQATNIEWSLQLMANRETAKQRAVRASVWRPAKTPVGGQVPSQRPPARTRPIVPMTTDEATALAEKVSRLQRSTGKSKSNAPDPVDGPRSAVPSFVPTDTRKHGNVSQVERFVARGVPPPPGGHAPRYAQQKIPFFCPSGVVQMGIRGSDSCCQPG